MAVTDDPSQVDLVNAAIRPRPRRLDSGSVEGGVTVFHQRRRSHPLVGRLSKPTTPTRPDAARDRGRARNENWRTRIPDVR